MRNTLLLPLTLLLSLVSSTVGAGQFVIELNSPLSPPPEAMLSKHSVSLDQAFSAGADSYAVFSASDEDALHALIKDAGLEADKISPVLYVNSPTVGGGKAAGATPKAGHQVFVIERSIPGVGSLPEEQMRDISIGSNTANMKIGDPIEWDHSYLTSEGTYCVYRADSPDRIYEQSAISGAPVNKVTSVTHITYRK